MATELRGSAAILDLNPLADVMGSRQGEGRDQAKGKGPFIEYPVARFPLYDGFNRPKTAL
jgi:hypothetical protein